MDDDRLKALLRDLPRAEARPGFNERVLGRLDREGDRQDQDLVLVAPPRARFAGWAVAAAACAIAALTFGGWRVEQGRERERQRARLELLREEQRALATELRRLREAAELPRSQVYLGGDENVDVVFDLAHPIAARNPGARRGVVPARVVSQP